MSIYRVNIEKITNEYMECKAVNRMLENDNDQLKKDILDLKNQVFEHMNRYCIQYS